jgi:DNA polymerase III alpha subunit
VLVEFSKKHQVKLVATNNTYYTNQEESTAHDILLCVKDGEKIATPIGKGRGFRYGLPNNEYYFKSQEQMKSLFSDLPDAITNIQEIVDKIEIYTLARNVLLPKFAIPQEFVNPEDEKDGGVRGENAYLKHLTFEGAKKRYGEILTDDLKERLDFELSVIEKTGYPGYFLIVWDFILEARKMNVAVGPGRGSAAGSVVAYCLWITNIDPIKYDLLFERFLNPDRVSLPDIDIDFDDEGRQKVIDFVIQKYGASQVAQIITYGTMAAKSSIRDTARVLDLPLFDADRIAKLIPLVKLKNIFGEDEKSKAISIHIDCFGSYIDDEFAANLDTTYAKFRGYKLAIQYFKNEIEKLSENPNEHQQQINVYKPNLIWTGSKTGAVETIYLLHASEVFNNGKATIKEIADTFQYAFNIDLGDFYHIFSEIKKRKNVIPKFLNVAMAKLLAYIKASEK